MFAFRRSISTLRKIPPLAFSFDIDGVLLRGETVIPAAKRALAIVNGDNPWDAKIPFILMTNGGGVKESVRARLLSRQLDFQIHESQFIQSHTVLRSLASHASKESSLANHHILVVGGIGDTVRIVAENYGFKHVHTPLDILAWNPAIWPYHQLSDYELSTTRKTDFSQTPISSIFVFHDPRNWALDIQIMTDVIRSYPNGLGTSYPIRDSLNPAPSVSLYFCNPDLLWRAHYNVPRFGQGAFREAFQAVFKASTGQEHPYTQYGKPHELTYEYGKSMLQAQFAEMYGLDAAEPEFFMIGDNPESDIAGANKAGWSSLLVETGVYDPSAGLPPSHKPTDTVLDVEQAVLRAIEMARNNINASRER